MKKAHYSYIEIYNRNVFYGSDIKEILKLAKTYLKGENADYSLITELGPALGFVAPTPDKDDDERVYAYVMYVGPGEGLGAICHEATHLTNFIFDYIGQDLDLCNDEAQAYLAGYITDQFCENIRSIKTKTGKLKRK